jgi:hypothetical protein
MMAPIPPSIVVLFGWAGFCKDYNEAGQLVIAFIVHRCWVSAFQALPHLDADAGTLTFQNTTLEKEGWERDTSIQEPVEPDRQA